jgi:hypothetical protein
MAIHDDKWTKEFNMLSLENIRSIKVKEFFTLFFIQITSYSILCVNYRAVADAHYHTAALSDFLIASMSFFVIRKIAQSTDAIHQWAGYALGSVIGSYLGIWVSSTFLGG